MTSNLRAADLVRYPWYDSVWLGAYVSAKELLREKCPHRVEEFDRAFDALRTSPDFQIRVLRDVFDADTLAAIRGVIATLAPRQLELHEAQEFRRFVVHDHPYFTQLHQHIVEVVSEAAGEPVEPSYNFLSLYGPQGVCPIHMDAPVAKWTLDYCVDQSVEWPIHFSGVVPWPEPSRYQTDWEAQIRREIGHNCSTHRLRPGEALLFAGSSQWHWRDPMPAGGTPGHCDLLFFHFIPRGTAELVDPANWARLFKIPELADLRETS